MNTYLHAYVLFSNNSSFIIGSTSFNASISAALLYETDFNSPNTPCTLQNTKYMQTGFITVPQLKKTSKTYLHIYIYHEIFGKSYLSANSAPFFHTISHSDFYFISQSCKLLQEKQNIK